MDNTDYFSKFEQVHSSSDPSLWGEVYSFLHDTRKKLPLDKKEEIRELALSASALSQVCSAQSNQHAIETHFGWHDLNLPTSIIQEVL